MNVSQVVSLDLAALNESLQLDADRARRIAPSPPALAALTFVARKQGPGDDLAALARACARRAAQALYEPEGLAGYQVLLFVADGPWQEATAVLRHKKLWKRRGEILTALGLHAPPEEVAFERGGDVRFASLAPVDRDHFPEAVEVARRDPACAILASKHAAADAESIRAIFAAAFPDSAAGPETSVDWASLALSRCPLGDVAVRASGRFDDPDAAVDLIVDPTQLPPDALGAP